MDELKKLLENAGMNEAEYRWPDEHYKGLADDALHKAFEDVYLHIRETDAKKAEALLQAMNKVWLVLETEWKDPTRRGGTDSQWKGGDHGYDRDYPMADPTGTMKAPIDDYTKR